MNSIYGTPATGLRGADFELEVVANNIANVNTSGFAAVEPLVASLPSEPEIGDPNNGIPIPATTHVGMGVRPSGTMRSQTQALLEPTGDPLDLALTGERYFVLRGPGGELVYTPQVSLHVQPKDGQLVSAQGFGLVPPVRLAAGAAHVSVAPDGTVWSIPDVGPALKQGRLSVVTFAAPENLRAEGDGVYAETLGSGRPRELPPDQAQVVSGYQLKSTVDLATELVNMIQAERMYQANTKALQTLDSLVSSVVSGQ